MWKKIQLIQELNLYQTELEIQNEDLQESYVELEIINDKYKQLFEFAPIGYFTIDQNGLILKVNNEGGKLLGISPEMLIKKCFGRYVAPDFHHIYTHHRQNVLKQDKSHRCEIKLLKRNGSIFFAEIESKKLSQSDQLQILSFVSDISERKQSEFLTHNYQNKVALSEKNHIMNELLNKIIQEFNQPIGIINNYVQGIIRRLTDGAYDIDTILDALHKTKQQSDRASDIILRIKNFNYPNEIKYESVCIHSLIQDTITLINYEICNSSITIYNRCRLGDLQIKIDKIHIQQVLLNLARNAIEAMKDAKTESPKLIIEAAKISNKFIEICIIDNGPSFDKNDIHKLTDPYFTTKSYGVGLGLAICRRIIETHKGKLSIELNPTDGACFKFTLPI